MINALKIFGFTILVSVFYSYVGQMVPQKETYPPEETELSATMTTAELVEVGAELVAGKGTCLSCHTIGEEGALRFPDLGGIGAAAATRQDGMTDVAYLAESLYEPNAFIVEGFQGGMPVINKPPIGLNDQEILAVIAYLQSLGGTPTVTLETDVGYETEEAPGAAMASATPAAPRSGAELFEAYLCNTCHSLTSPEPLVGPSLYDAGERFTTAELYEAIMEPDATLAEGFPGGVMPATLSGTGFYDRVTSAELKALVDYLAAQRGGS